MLGKAVEGDAGQASSLTGSQPHARDVAAWVARYGTVLTLPADAFSFGSGAPESGQGGDAGEGDPVPGSELPMPARQPDQAVLLRRSAEKLWSEGRANPVWFRCATWLGTWITDDRVTWRTVDGAWLAQLERSRNGQHVSLALFHEGIYQGRQDARGFHSPSTRSRTRRPRPDARSLPLPLAV